MSISRLHVSLQFDSTKELISVGELVLDQRLIHFKYDEAFIATTYNLSPIRLPFTNDIFTGKANLFDGLPGLFYDSLPDSWGRLLLDRMLSSAGENLANINALDRLAHVGSMGFGALVYKPSIVATESHSKTVNLDQLATESHLIIQGSSSDVIEELFALGGSSGGARPKVGVMYSPSDNEIIYNSEPKTGYENWLIKFPSSFDEPDIAHIEYAYYLMAKAAGIEMMPSQLFMGASGKYYFGTKRFDRNKTERLHVHTAAGLMHDDFRYSQMDYGHLMDAGFQLTRHVKTYEKVLLLAAFNLYAHNRDDHSKNFSFIMNQQGVWNFAPAYDLTFSSSSQGHHSTMFAGESLHPTQTHLQDLAKSFGVSNIAKLIDQVKSATSNWRHFAEEAGVSALSRSKIQNVLNSLLKV